MAAHANKPVLAYFEGKIGELRIMRFWSKVDMRGPDECWDWKESLTHGNTGYGRFKVASYVTLHSSRVAWSLANKREPGELIVRHKCDRPRCCNPAHLEIGTIADNSRDMVLRGRARNGCLGGVRNPRAKLTEAQVADIVLRLRRGENNKQIARHHPIGHALVSRIRLGLSWRKETAALGWQPVAQFRRPSRLVAEPRARTTRMEVRHG